MANAAAFTLPSRFAGLAEQKLRHGAEILSQFLSRNLFRMPSGLGDREQSNAARKR
jgi:hypothetical protein